MNFALNIEKSCRRSPEKTCVVHDDVELTFRQMEERATRLARALLEMGVEPGDRVAVFQTNCFQFCEMLYAIGIVGGIFVNLNFRLRENEVSYILNNCEPKVLILGDRYAGLIDNIRENIPSLEHFLVIGNSASGMKNYESALALQPPEPLPLAPAGENDTACLIYTSGTTGYPKGAMLTHANIQTPLSDRYTFGEGTLLLNVPMYHIAGVISVLLPLYRGDTLIVLPQFDTRVFLNIAEEKRVASTYLVPTMLQGILDHADFDGKDLSSLKSIGYGASPMPTSLLLRAREALDADYTNYFGMTESTGIISVLSPEDHRLEGSKETIEKKSRRLTGIGYPIPEGEVRVVDDQDHSVPIGEVGEIVVRGKKVMKGYWNKPRETEAALRGGWLHTGDLAKMDEDRYLYLAGRKKDMIIRGGENIYPVEIENVLHSHPKVLEAAVVGLPDEYWGEIVKAFIICKPGQQVEADEITEFCRTKLASYKKPAIVEFVTELPKNAMQKVLKHVLRGEQSQ